MKDIRRARRVGMASILCALCMRLWAAGVPEKIAAWLVQPNTAAFLIYLETGRDVRFSSSSEVFSPDFVETPAPSAPMPTEPPLPSFSGEEGVEVTYAASKDPDLAALLAKPLTWDLMGEEPTVLILHTHSTESYTRRDEPYTETSRWRTLDEDYNMLSIGAHVAQLLTQGGIAVVQDRELHDYPSYNGSYVSARRQLKALLEQFPGIRLVLDLHRDASGEEGRQLRPLVQGAEEACAQLMVVLGTNHENYEENLSLGLKLHTQLERQQPGIMRPLQLRASRFNQDLCPGALLIEVGAAGNTHREALAAAEHLAQAILTLAKGSEQAIPMEGK